MPLPSQNQGSDSRRTYMYRRARPRGRRMMIGVSMTVIGIAVVWFGLPVVTEWFSSDGSSDPNSDVALTQLDDAGGDDLRNKPGVPAIARGADSYNGGSIGEGTPRTSNPQRNDGPGSSSTGLGNGEIQMGGDSTPPRTPNGDDGRSAQESRPADPTPAMEEPASSDPSRLSRAQQRVRQGMDLLNSNDPIEGRRILTRALISGELSYSEEQQIRDVLTEVNDRLVFSPYVTSGDPFAISYTIKDNDRMSKIVRSMGVQIHWKFVERVNAVKAERIRPGNRLKLITGPFHAVVHKRDYRLDLFLGEGEDLAYVRSFTVGLGELDSTPVGLFSIRSKLEDPDWRNPRTGEYFESGDPANPIGEYWIGLTGMSEALRDVTGYGIHGTIDHGSVGDQRSMGCVRMLPDDIALMYEVLVMGASTVEITE